MFIPIDVVFEIGKQSSGQTLMRISSANKKLFSLLKTERQGVVDETNKKIDERNSDRYHSAEDFVKEWNGDIYGIQRGIGLFVRSKLITSYLNIRYYTTCISDKFIEVLFDHNEFGLFERMVEWSISNLDTTEVNTFTFEHLDVYMYKLYGISGIDKYIKGGYKKIRDNSTLSGVKYINDELYIGKIYECALDMGKVEDVKTLIGRHMIRGVNYDTRRVDTGIDILAKRKRVDLIKLAYSLCPEDDCFKFINRFYLSDFSTSEFEWYCDTFDCIFGETIISSFVSSDSDQVDKLNLLVDKYQHKFNLEDSIFSYIFHYVFQYKGTKSVLMWACGKVIEVGGDLPENLIG